MNTLTVSVVLLVAATIAGVAIVNLLQGMRTRGNRRELESPHTQPTAMARNLGRESRFEPVLISPEPVLDEPGPALGTPPSERVAVGIGPEPGFAAHDTNGANKRNGDIEDIDFLSGGRPAPELADIGSAAYSALRQPADGVQPSGTATNSVARSAAQSAAQSGSQSAARIAAQSATTADKLAMPVAPPVAPTVAYRAAGTSALDPRVDCIIEFTLVTPWSGHRLLQLAQSCRRVGSKPVVFDGMIIGASAAAPTAATAPLETAVLSAPLALSWTQFRAEKSYRQVRAGVLLANRHGPLNAMEFSEFVAMANRLAEAFEAAPLLPDMNATLHNARTLDAECIKLDAQLGINIDCADVISPAVLARIARENALAERGNNRFARLGGADEVLFSLALSDKPNRVTLLLDVPRAPVDQKPWPALLACAHSCLAPLQGHVVDDGGRPLNARNLDSLSAELAQRYAMLDQSGFKAGSPLALRVFN